jgi:hypothetical protein
LQGEWGSLINLLWQGRLAQFGFYGTIHEIKDLLHPLIDTLDARADVETYEDLHPGELSMHSDQDQSHHVDLMLDTIESSQKFENRWDSVSPQSYLVLRSKEQMIGKFVRVCLHLFFCPSSVESVLVTC